MKSTTKVGSDLLELAERLAEGDRLCAATADDAMRREYHDYTTHLAWAIASFKARLGSILASTPLLTPQLREWAVAQASDDEIVAGIDEVQEKGGTELGEVIQRLKQKRKDRERTNP
jgi:hypothetical protein